jgi:hypothetical protein
MTTVSNALTRSEEMLGVQFGPDPQPRFRRDYDRLADVSRMIRLRLTAASKVNDSDRLRAI